MLKPQFAFPQSFKASIRFLVILPSTYKVHHQHSIISSIIINYLSSTYRIPVWFVVRIIDFGIVTKCWIGKRVQIQFHFTLDTCLDSFHLFLKEIQLKLSGKSSHGFIEIAENIFLFIPMSHDDDKKETRNGWITSTFMMYFLSCFPFCETLCMQNYGNIIFTYKIISCRKAKTFS